MRVLVTGGAGFIGGHLVQRLVRDGHEVTVLDDLSTGRRENLTVGARVFQGDVRDAERVGAAAVGADVVFHLAAAVGPGLVAQDPVGTWSRNVLGTAVVLDACMAHGARVLIASSSEVYGDAHRPAALRGRPLIESEVVTHQPSGRRDVYALSKLAGEAYALALYRSALLPVTVIRPFNVVGPGQSSRYGMVLARFAEAAVRGEPLPVYGDGSQRRCFLHVEDAVEALLMLAGTPQAEGRIVNVGGAESISIRALAERVLARHGRGGTCKTIPFERVYGEGFMDHHSREADTSLVRSLTGWQPTRSLDDAIDGALAAARHRAYTSGT